MIIEVRESPLKTKRFRATILKHNGEKEKIDFGQKNSVTFVDGMRTEQERNNYLARHMANPIEKKLIQNLTPSASLLSGMLLWGKHKSIEKNIKELNNLWKKKYK